MKKALLLLVAGLCTGGSALAQRSLLPSPLQPRGPDAVLGGLVASPDLELVRELARARGSLVLVDFLLPSGESVALELDPIDLERRRFGFQVDGRERADLLSGLDLSVWKGAVAGEPGSELMLGFSSEGTRGWIRRGSELVHLVARPGAAGSWREGEVLLVTEAALNAAGLRPPLECATAPSAPPPLADPGRLPGQPVAGTCSLLECTVAMETDYQLFQVFGSLPAEAAYVATLLSWISARYEEQIGTVLTYPYVQLYSDPNDPWTTPDTGGNSVAMLYEFRDAWQGNVPMGATLAHFMSGANLGGGVAWLDVLCSTTLNFAVSGNINGTTSFPVQQGPDTWDFMVIAHEIGHNFGSPHTHDFCPPLDQCAPSGYFGQCQTQQVCTDQGTIMSYCHLCPGGMTNITTFFHPTCVLTMRTRAEACLPSFAGISGDVAALFDPDAPTELTVRIAGLPVGPVQLHHRFGAGAWVTQSMVSQGPGLFAAEVPPAPCGVLVEYYYSYVEASCGPASDPSGAPASVHSAPVGAWVAVFSDDFETDQGWVATNLGASSGDWQRGVPVNDPSWDYDPTSDFDGSGQCWLTQNTLGNSDVDNGAVRLASPVLDLSGTKVNVDYAYYLRLTNSNGTDALRVEISTNGAAGPWTEIARHDTDGGTAWRTHRVTKAELDALGILPSATTQLRFTANDDGTQSIVEAALDAFAITRLSCSPGTLGTRYCLSVANSTGAPAFLYAAGSTSLADDDFALSSQPVPNQQGLFFHGPNQTQLPFGDGFRCVGGAIARLNPPSPASGNVATRVVDLAQQGFAPGQTRHFQHWYRDPAAGLSGYNLSDAVSVTFTP